MRRLRVEAQTCVLAVVTVFAAALDREPLAYTSDADLLRGQLAALRECDVLEDEAHAEAVGRLDAAIEDARRRASFDVRPGGTSQPVRRRSSRCSTPGKV